MTIPLKIEPLLPTPDHLTGLREEANQLPYRDSHVLVALEGTEVVGAIRYCERDDPWRRHGLIADLQIDGTRRGMGIEECLIEAAEERLLALGVRKIDALIRDGEGWAPHYYRKGYWPSRKTVVMEWDLAQMAPLEPASPFPIEFAAEPDVAEVTQLVIDSYQPYWRWWREHREDRRWIRVEWPAQNQPLESTELELEMRQRVSARVQRIHDDPQRAVFLARQGDRVVGLCDASRHQGSDQLDLGVLVLRDFGGRRLGSALLGHALRWLRDGAVQRARVTTTSGLDDYDPTVYLYNACGARIVVEFINLVKRSFHQLGEDPAQAAQAVITIGS